MNYPTMHRRDLGVITRLQRVPDNIATGILMRNARLHFGFTLREMARRLKWSAAYVSDLEKGRRGWTEEKVERWKEVLFE